MQQHRIQLRGVAQVIELLPSKHEAPSLNSSYHQEKKKQKKPKQ
jgi:hypothetical protein